MNETRPGVSSVGVQCFVITKAGLLLGCRTGGWKVGTWSLPGGHLEQGETILEAASRELEEETGLAARRMRIAAIGDPIQQNNWHLQIGVLVESFEGEPRVTAPDEFGELGYFPLEALPFPILISSEYLIEKLVQKKLY